MCDGLTSTAWWHADLGYAWCSSENPATGSLGFGPKYPSRVWSVGSPSTRSSPADLKLELFDPLSRCGRSGRSRRRRCADHDLVAFDASCVALTRRAVEDDEENWGGHLVRHSLGEHARQVPTCACTVRVYGGGPGLPGWIDPAWGGAEGPTAHAEAWRLSAGGTTAWRSRRARRPARFDPRSRLVDGAPDRAARGRLACPLDAAAMEAEAVGGPRSGGHASSGGQASRIAKRPKPGRCRRARCGTPRSEPTSCRVARDPCTASSVA